MVKLNEYKMSLYFRALVNFTRSITYSPQLEDAGSREFREVSEAVVDTVRELDGWVFVELDVGSEGNPDGAQIQEVLHRVVSSGSMASYITSPQGFQFRRLGTGMVEWPGPALQPSASGSQVERPLTTSSFSAQTPPPLLAAVAVAVTPETELPYTGHRSPLQPHSTCAVPTALHTSLWPSLTPVCSLPPAVPQFPRACTEAEFACHSYNECVALEYRCDRRPDCRDMSDELNCGEGMSRATSGLGPNGRPGSYTRGLGVSGTMRLWCRQSMGA
ncbi:hypothetical protein P7K49_015637 [Saguinus oedipus]|uniref:SEA domain-containing protein n=1 Tax=Saguinus oedipus TaxID=9490 RepID=A0ABQ9V9T6_SAGOE|nr:hypothetical protein P7K49_015637 [Saguinus oedipus]